MRAMQACPANVDRLRGHENWRPLQGWESPAPVLSKCSAYKLAVGGGAHALQE